MNVCAYIQSGFLARVSVQRALESRNTLCRCQVWYASRPSTATNTPTRRDCEPASGSVSSRGSRTDSPVASRQGSHDTDQAETGKVLKVVSDVQEYRIR